MSRNVSMIYTVVGILTAKTPIHMGGLDGGNPDSDMPLAVDGQGRYYVPGTSLAGALRQWTEVNLGTVVVQSLWGFQEGKEGNASLFAVEDGTISEGVLPEVRDGVGIDKKTGTARRRIKYSTTILPRGTQIEFQCSLSVIHDKDKSDAEGALRLLLEALLDGRIRLGAQRTRGMGKVVLKKCFSITRSSLNTRQGIIDHLRGLDENVNVESLPISQCSGSHRMEVVIHWHPTEPLMVKSGVDGIAVDGLPLVGGIDGDHVTLVMPGSSIKGVLSSRASLIVRTVTGQESEDKSSKASIVLERLFGVSRATAVSKDASKDAVEGMGMLAVDDCYATDSFERCMWKKFTTALDDKEAKQAFAGTPVEDKMREVYHVAIDRWTGGASDQKLFNQIEPQGIAWEPISLSLDFSRLEDQLDSQKEMMALLLLVLRDMASGRLQLGFGTNRGMGSVAIDHIILTPSGISWMKEGADLNQGDIAALPPALIKNLQQAWQATIAN